MKPRDRLYAFRNIALVAGCLSLIPLLYLAFKPGAFQSILGYAMILLGIISIVCLVTAFMLSIIISDKKHTGA